MDKSDTNLELSSKSNCEDLDYNEDEDNIYFEENDVDWEHHMEMLREQARELNIY
jgi:hypothetical protein